MNAYVDTLAEWWENAERISRTNMPNDGDTIMYPSAGGAYTIEPATFGWVASIIHPDDNVRILHRAPKHKPAWHDAVAVVGRCSIAPEGNREVFIKSDATPGVWIGEGGYGYTDDLRDVTPLIEAKVTEAMVDRLRDAVSDHSGKVSRDDIRAWVRAALGLDPA